MPRQRSNEPDTPAVPFWRRPAVLIGAAIGLGVLVLAIVTHRPAPRQAADLNPAPGANPAGVNPPAAEQALDRARDAAARSGLGPGESGAGTGAWGMTRLVRVLAAPAGGEPGMLPARVFAPIGPGKGQPAMLFGLPPTPPRPEPHKLPKGFRIQAGARIDPSGWPLEIVADKDGSELVFVPGGAFTMGRDDGPPEQAPAHRVVLKPFYVGKDEVTMGQYAAYRKATSARVLPHEAAEAAPQPDCPAVGVTWNEAAAYAKWAGLRLPTEAQWEKAARGSDGRLHPWGPGPAIWLGHAGSIHPVGSQPWNVSPYGCRDMGGSAWEWCVDWFDPGYYARSPKQDPAGPRHPLSTARSRRALRGGSPEAIVTWRTGRPITEWTVHYGFRCVLAVPDKRPVSEGPAPLTAVLPSPGVSALVGPAPAAAPDGG